jgi:hypothetical protein
MLLERADDLARLNAAVKSARDGFGKFVIVRGEAGIGKTSLLGEFAHRQEDDCRVLSGACSHLATPMPLEPFWDMTDIESGIATALSSHDVHGLYRELHRMFDRRTRPTVLIIDDIHWSDQATLDIVRRLGRRVGELHGALVVSFRDEEVVLDHPVQRVVGELPPASTVHIKLRPLTEESVSKLAGAVDARAIWERTGGNPLLVTETIRSGEDVPEAITQQVLARLGRLAEGSRSLIELVSLVPGSCERAVVDDLIDADPAVLGEAEQSGLLLVAPGSLAFRHELIRRAVEQSLPAATRMSLNRDLHDVLEARDADVTRLVHHAIEGGDDDALLRSVPRAVEIAVTMGSYREARHHLLSIEHLLGRLDDLQHAALLDTWAKAEDLLGDIGKAMALRQRAIDLYQTAGSTTRLTAVSNVWPSCNGG